MEFAASLRKCTFLAYKKQRRKWENLTPFESETLRCLPHFCSDKGFQSTVVNQALQSLLILKYAYSPFKNTIVGPKLTFTSSLDINKTVGYP